MTQNEMRQLVLGQAALLGPRLYEGMAVALQDADQRSRGLPHDRFPHLRPLIARAVVRQYLEQEGLPEPWLVEGNPALMGQLYLAATDLGLTLRVLKERRGTYPGGVPVAGRNPTRQEAWQAPLPLQMPADTQSKATELLLLWDYTHGTDHDATGPDFSLRIVHTVEAGQYGQRVRCDLDLTVQTGGNIFTRLAFPADDDEEDFFAVTIDQRENAESGSFIS